MHASNSAEEFQNTNMIGAFHDIYFRSTLKSKYAD